MWNSKIEEQNMANELIKLFLIDGVGTSGEDFKVKFQTLLDRVPRIHSTLKPEFFISFFLGSALTLPYTKLKEEIGIKDMCAAVNHRSKTVKLVYKVENSQGKQLIFKTITTASRVKEKQHMSRAELREILGTLGLTQVDDYKIKGEIVHIKDGKLKIEGLKVEKEDLYAVLREIVSSGSTLPGVIEKQAEFKKVKDNVVKSNFDDI